ncbi:MAG: hypothetical protein JO317_01310 [Verrucomicrobiae bacterium]|nr:hypothetical protein [Verrucomicrobiae bacterium]
MKRREVIADPDLKKVRRALERAAERALALGKRTHTPVYIYRRGKIVDVITGTQRRRAA